MHYGKKLKYGVLNNSIIQENFIQGFDLQIKHYDKPFNIMFNNFNNLFDDNLNSNNLTSDNINSNNIHNNYWKLIKWGAKEYYLECSTNNVYMEDYDNFVKMGVWSEGMII